ncbi:MAG: SMP-30/gluconolactonase/LRE family protein [Stellaceae bacterium]
MASLTHFLRDARQILFRNAEQHAIPSMDGALSPNDALDQCVAIGDKLPGADDVAEGPDGALYVSAGPQVLRLSGEGYKTRAVVTEFEQSAGGLAFHPDGRLLVCVADRGLAAVDAAGRQRWLNQVEDRPLRCLTDVVAAADGTIFASEGSRLNATGGWCRDLLQKNRAGSLIVCGPELEAPKVLLRDLAYPQGLAVSADGRFLWLTESWSHRVSRAAINGRSLGPPEIVIHNLPGYPARLGRAASGGFWLSIFARRTHLIEFVLREDDFREEMIRTIAPEHWIGPALATQGDALEPMQGGSIKALGIQKPWAPPRSYGLLMRIDDDGEAVESLHSRVGGRYHGITAACDAAQGLVIVSKGAGRVLLDTVGARS